MQNIEIKTIIRKAIGFNEWGYNNLIHKNFVTWCEVMALKFFHNDRDLIQDERLFLFYQNQWYSLVERRLFIEYRGYMSKEIHDAADFYYKELCNYANELERYYPASIIKAPKPSKHLKYQFNYN